MPCSPSGEVIDRMMANLSVTFAVRGKYSQISMPVVLVLIGWNGPRTSAGTSGLRSNVSRWLGPPSSHSRMHDFAFAGLSPAEARARNKSGNPRPSALRPPRRRISRRLTPSQRRVNAVEDIRCFLCRLVVRGEFAAVQEAPEKIFEALAAAIFASFLEAHEPVGQLFL